MDRRRFLISCPLFGLACTGTQRGQVSSANSGQVAAAAERPSRHSSARERRIAVTMDDPNTRDAPRYSVEERNRAILEHLKQRHVQVMLFVCGKRIDSPAGAEILSSFNAAGHLLANHSYGHSNYNEVENSSDVLQADISKCEKLIANYSGFRRFFRFPYLKEGETPEKRDTLRDVLRARGYANGHVTIDASDWVYHDRLVLRLTEDSSLDLGPFREAYLEHMLGRARYYDDLATTVTGYSIPHTMLVHHNLLNALFLGDLIDAFEREGFRVVAPEEAYADPVFAREPTSIPAGESLIWALAHDDVRLRAGLRYPGEDGSYEAEALGQL